MNNIQILRGADNRPVQQLTPDDSFVCTLKQMGEQAVRMTVSAVQPLDLRVGDHFEWQGVRYTLTDEPDYKRSEGTYTYTLVFYAPYHRLSYLLHKDEGSLTFPYDGNLEQQIDALYTSIGREASGFTVDIEPGIETAAEFRHIEFDKTYCLDALTRICEEFGTEWHIVGQAIRIGRFETTPAGLFRYGRGKGLYSLEKIGVSDASVVTRLYGFGSSDNLPQGYRTQTLEFLGVGGKSFLEKNIDKYGIREETVTFDDIYPHLEGASLSGVTVPPDIAKATGWTVTMKLPADCNDIVIEKDKSDPQIKFTSGALMGESFTITGLDAAAGRLDFNTSEDNGYKLPSQSRQPAVGDGFVLLGIVMPQSYVDRAEAELKARTQEELDRRCEKQYAYRLDIDPRYVRSEEIRVRVGDTLLVQESDDTEPVGIRVSEVSYPLQDPEKLSLVLSDTPVYTSYSEKIENDIKDVTHEVINVYREARAFSRRAWRDAEELASMIDSLKADLVLVGNHAGQFAVGSTFTVNKSNDVNLFGCTPGTLQHAVYKGATDGVWSMKEANIILQPDIACYLYAKCSHTSGDGFYRVVPQRIDVEQEEGWYHFPVGVISSPFEGARVFNTTYGFTQLSGGSITTGRLQDPARRMVVDLDNGTITGPVRFTAGTSGLDQVAEWTKAVKRIEKTEAVTGNFDNDTEINGGLLLTSQIKMRDGGKETGGLSADRDNVLLWGGGTYDLAKTNAVNILLRHDGSGQLSKSQITWDTEGNLRVNEGAMIGDFLINKGYLCWNGNGRKAAIGAVGVTESDNSTVAEFSVPHDRINPNIAVRITGGQLLMQNSSVGGLALHVESIDKNYTVKFDDTYLLCQNTTQEITVTLPYRPVNGRTLYLRRSGGGKVRLKPGVTTSNIELSSPGYQPDKIVYDTPQAEGEVNEGLGGTAMLVYYIPNWYYNKMSL